MDDKNHLTNETSPPMGPRAWLMAARFVGTDEDTEISCLWLSGHAALAIDDKLGAHAQPWSPQSLDEVFGEAFEGFNAEARRRGLRTSYGGDVMVLDGPIPISLCYLSVEGYDQHDLAKTRIDIESSLLAAVHHVSCWTGRSAIPNSNDYGLFTIFDLGQRKDLDYPSWHKEMGAFAKAAPWVLSSMERAQMEVSSQSLHALTGPRRRFL